MKYVKSVSLSIMLMLAVLLFSQAASASRISFHVFESDLPARPAKSFQQRPDTSNRNGNGWARFTQQNSELKGEQGEKPWWNDEPLWSGDSNWKRNPWWRSDPAWRENNGWKQNPWWREPGVDKSDRADVVALFSGESAFSGYDRGATRAGVPSSRSDRRGNGRFVQALRREYLLAWKVQWLFRKHSDEPGFDITPPVGGPGVDSTPPAVIPVPAAAWLMASGLGLLGLFRRKTGGSVNP